MTDFTATRRLFDLPEGIAYLDGNSLGPLPKSVPARIEAVLRDEWGRMAIGGWNRAGWMAAPARVGDRIARLIGAPAGSVTMGDTLSVKVYQALASALDMRPDRRVILSDTGNFPTDLYMAEGLIRSLDKGLELRLVAPEDVASAIDDSVAVLMLTEVDYRTGRRHDMAALTARAHEAGALAIWDLAHSAGALAVDVTAAGADFAVGCTYKFLNGGPGAPAFIHVAPRHADRVRPVLSGWLGHEAPFAFDLDYRPARGVERMRVGTPPVLGLAALDAALDAFDGIEMTEIEARSRELSERFRLRVAARGLPLTLASPEDPMLRGSQLSFRFAKGYAAMQALIARGVVGDFRAPDIMRFGITPLHVGEAEIDAAVDALDAVLTGRLWDDPAYRARATVT
jgi:kynureninase